MSLTIKIVCALAIWSMARTLIACFWTVYVKPFIRGKYNTSEFPIEMSFRRFVYSVLIFYGDII